VFLAAFGALSARQQIAAVHRDADDILIGEGTGVVVLKRLTDAERDGDRVTRDPGVPVSPAMDAVRACQPDPGGQVLAIRKGLAGAGLEPGGGRLDRTARAHGHATPAVTRPKCPRWPRFSVPREAAVIGSVKSMIGHTMPPLEIGEPGPRQHWPCTTACCCRR